MSRTRNLPDEDGGRSFRQWFLTSDPGLTRLRMGSRVLLTVVLVAGVLVLIHPWLALPPAAYGLGMVTAIQGAVAIKDATPAARAVTRAYAALAGMAVVCLIVFLPSHGLALNLLFLVVIFVAVFARQWGLRWQGVGMFSFMCFVIAAYLRPAISDLPGIAVSLVLSAVIAHVIRNALLPDRPARDFRRILSALEDLVGQIAGLMRRGARDGWTPATRRAVLAEERRAKDMILLCEGFLPLDNTSGETANGRAAALASHLFDLHLALESAVGAALRQPPAVDGKIPAPVTERLEILARARREVRRTANATPGEAFTSTMGREPARPAARSKRKPLENPALRSALQVTIASAIAMTGGIFLSPDRWFWAVLTAFLIFTNTQSRGEATIRGVERALGTGLGIVAGIGLAAFLHGAVAPTVVLVAISIFLGFYLLTLSYSAMSFFVTVAISLVYGLIGSFSPELLILRLEETLIGAAAGIFVSFFVLSRSTRSLLRQAVDRFMLSLDALLETVSELKPGDSGARLLVRARQLDRAHADILAALGPLQSAWSFGAGQTGLRRALMRFNALAHSAHVLTRRFTAQPPTPAELARLAQIRALIAGLRENGRNFSGRSKLAEVNEAPEPESEAASSESVDIALRSLSHVLQQADPRNQERAAA